MSKELDEFNAVVEKVREILKRRGLTDEQIEEDIKGLREWWKNSPDPIPIP